MTGGLNGLQVLKKYSLAIFCFLLFVSGLVFIFVQGDRLPELTTQEETLNSRIEVIERNVRNSANLESQLEQAEAAVEAIQSRRFKREERAVNANFFYDLETDFGVRITSINQRPDDYVLYEKEGIHELKRNSSMVYNLSLAGQLTDLLLFVHQLTQAEPFMRVANLQLSVDNRAAGALQCELIVVVLAERE
jgi:sortase (surface protein transpeptidase)